MVIERAGFLQQPRWQGPARHPGDAPPRRADPNGAGGALRDGDGDTHLQERHQVGLFIRRDRFGRFFSALLYLPRERYNTDTRLAAQRIMMESLRGVSIDYEARVSESPCWPGPFRHPDRPGETVDNDVADIEKRIEEAVRSWGTTRPSTGRAARRRPGSPLRTSTGGLPTRLLADFRLEWRYDIRRLEWLISPRTSGCNSADRSRRKRLVPAQALPLRLTHRRLRRPSSPRTHGCPVVEQHPYEIDIGVGRRSGSTTSTCNAGDVVLLDTGLAAELFQNALARVARRDGGRRVQPVGAEAGSRGTTWPCCAPTPSTFARPRSPSARPTWRRLSALNSHIAELVELFHARFDPAITDHGVPGVGRTGDREHR